MREGTAPLIRREDYAPPPFWIRKVDLTFDLDPAKTLVIEPDAGRAQRRRRRRPAEAARRGPHADALPGQRRVGVVPPRGRPARHRQPARGQLHARDPQHLRAREEHRAVGPLHLGRRLLHAVRGRGLSPHHLLPRPARRDGRVHACCCAPTRRRIRCCCRTATWSSRATSTTAATSRSWHDPFPKPSYLFALVAADLVAREQHIRSRSGKDHLLQVYVRRGDLDKTEHAMNSLVASVVWDEARFGLRSTSSAS